MIGPKTPGQIAYEADCAYEPNYHDGTKRNRWEQLSYCAKDSWERNPTPRHRIVKRAADQ